MKNIHCVRCGQEILPDDLTCERCGKPVEFSDHNYIVTPMDNEMPLRIWTDGRDPMFCFRDKPSKIGTVEYVRSDAILPLLRELCEARKRCADQPGPKDNGDDFMVWCEEVKDLEESFTNTAYVIATRLSEIIAPLIGDGEGA